MKFLADMCVSQSTAQWLRGQRHDVIHIREVLMHKAEDREIIKKAVKEDRVILTHDLDFGDIMAASGDLRPSIIIFRLNNQKPDNVNERLVKVLEEASAEIQKGAIIIVEESKYRIRLLPM